MTPLEIELFRRAEKSFYPYSAYNAISYYDGCDRNRIDRMYLDPVLSSLNADLKKLGFQGTIEKPDIPGELPPMNLIVGSIARQLTDCLNSNPSRHEVLSINRGEAVAVAINRPDMSTEELQQYIDWDQRYSQKNLLGKIRMLLKIDP